MAVAGMRNIEESAAGAGLVLVVAVTAYNIFNRYVLRGSAAWAPELAGIIFAWVVFLGASAAWKRGMHISINVLTRQLGTRTQLVVRIIASTVLACFFAYAVWLAGRITISSYSRLSPVMRVSFSYVYASALLGFLLMLLHTLASLCRDVRLFGAARRRNGIAEPGGA